MSSLLSMGKRLFKKDDDDDEGSSGGIISALKSFDRDGDGKITENDFILCAQSLHLGSVGDSTARSIFKKIDKNGNGQLDTKEAISAIKHLKKLVPKESM